MRPRKHNRDLPACVYLRRGAHYYVKRGKWIPLGKDRVEALAEYARLTSHPRSGMAAMIDDYLPAVLKDKASQTVAQYTVAARRLQDILAEFAPEDVRSRDVAAIRRAYEDSPATANRMVTVLSMVFEQAKLAEVIDANPCTGVKRLKQDSRTRRITPAEYAAIYAKATPRLRVVMDLCYLTGQRIGDVLSIKRADLTDEGIFVKQQKTGSRLTVGWTPELTAACDAAKALHGPVAALWLVKGTHGAQMSYTVIWKDWRAACKAAGVADANIHDLRAMSGTDADAQGIDAQKLLGHSDRKTTKIYLRDKVVPVVHGPKFAGKK